MALNQADKSTAFSLVDIGANLHHRSYPENELQAVIDRAKASGVSKIMVTGTSVKNSKEALRLSQLYPNYLFSTAGLSSKYMIFWYPFLY